MRRFASIASGLFACVTGCGDDGGARHLADAPPTPDTPIDAIPSGTVNVTTLSFCCDVAPNTPRENVLVVAINPDGQVAGTAMTDAQGKASVNIKEGATVTVVYPETDNDTNIASYVGVKPDDNLTFGDKYYPTNITGGTTGQVVINWPAVAGATWYSVQTQCGNASYLTPTTLTVPLYDDCQTATSPILVVARNNNYRAIATAYLPAATFTPGTIDITAAQWTANSLDNFTSSVTGIPANTSDVYFEVAAQFNANMTEADGGYATPKNGAASVMLTIPVGAATNHGQMRVSRNNYGEQNYYKNGTSPLTFAAGTLPWISGVIFDPAEGHALWLQTQGSYDAATLFLDWQYYENKSWHYYRWSVVLPPGQTDFNLGTPAAELAAFLPTAKDNVDYNLELVDLSSASNYDAVRALPLWRVMDVQNAVRTGDEPNAAVSQYIDGGEGFAFTQSAKAH